MNVDQFSMQAAEKKSKIVEFVAVLFFLSYVSMMSYDVTRVNNS